MPPLLSYGLNLPNKSKPETKPGLNPLGGQKRKKTIFDDSDSETESPSTAATTTKDAGNEIEISTIGGVEDTTFPPARKSNREEKGDERPPKRKLLAPGSTAASKPPNFKPLSKKSIFADDDEEDQKDKKDTTVYGLNLSNQDNAQEKKKEYTNLSALHSSRKHAAEAETLDPSIYSYDAVYDSLHAKPDAKKKAAEEKGAGNEVPKYMTQLLRSAEVRKRDQMRARDRMLAKEREAEGDEFADKEKFVTAAYKAQQEELRRVQAEEEAREKEEEERRKKNGGSGMVGFYRDMLSRGEERHEAVVKAAEEAAKQVKDGVEEGAAGEEKKKSEAQVAAEMNAKGAHIAVNDEGQVVDKRQLLSAGLNVAPKPKAAPKDTAAAAASRASVQARFGAQRQERGGQRARQTEMIASQLEERTRQEEEAEAARQKEIAERSRSRKTEGDVSSAKERYLARKREREAAAKAA
ncbi:hypothetical protein BO78DRAFT_395194 [Aspergillus sclerotiicarbonarius CBS 121057]|uniref:Nuclear speckle splicing regulatory protein 1 N-terminal domain-containing protein n=1 Tax=Aspergillus sclerotiicarbonarius (strain CBS 121057 / IBT 28362) TaxID=1448318 RepID=A0A319EQ02_ASPSB|nr:hypothetical protein BO78DRAFT_395194 [Aspergillus sclerotiicarbonarius CBS 121057]